MNAQEARKKSTEVLSVITQEGAKKINKLIEEAIRKGEFQCTCYDTITDVVQKYFKDEGYLIQYNESGRNEYYYLIKW